MYVTICDLALEHINRKYELTEGHVIALKTVLDNIIAEGKLDDTADYRSVSVLLAYEDLVNVLPRIRNLLVDITYHEKYNHREICRTIPKESFLKILTKVSGQLEGLSYDKPMHNIRSNLSTLEGAERDREIIISAARRKIINRDGYDHKEYQSTKCLFYHHYGFLAYMIDNKPFFDVQHVIGIALDQKLSAGDIISQYLCPIFCITSDKNKYGGYTIRYLISLSTLVSLLAELNVLPDCFIDVSLAVLSKSINKKDGYTTTKSWLIEDDMESDDDLSAYDSEIALHNLVYEHKLKLLELEYEHKKNIACLKYEQAKSLLKASSSQVC